MSKEEEGERRGEQKGNKLRRFSLLKVFMLDFFFVMAKSSCLLIGERTE